MTLKTGPKRALIVLAAIGALVAYREAAYYGYVPRPNALKTVIPQKADIVDAEVLKSATVQALPLPSSAPASLPGPQVRLEEWAWNAQYGLNYANGGPNTTKGSLMEQSGVKLAITRQDDSGKMQADQIAFANSYCKGGSDSSGVHFINIMGDGAAQYLTPLNTELKKLGDDCQAEVVGIAGYSRNEDKFMGPMDWKANPQAAKGGLVAGVLRDGDWNLAMRWLTENGIPNNPDDRVYDPEALNWVNADTYIDAAQKYVANFCEDLPLKNKPAQKQHVCVSGVVTWTPGDVIVAGQRGGLVTLMSTGSAIFQMPCVIIGNKKWNAAHPDIVAGMLSAIGQAGDQVRSSNAAFLKAGEISAQIYKEKDANYWASYYRGVKAKDRQGLEVDLGGSAVSNLADMFQAFGLSGGPNLFKATYETFGAILVQQYPNLFKSIPPTATIQNTRYLQMAATRNADHGNAESTTYATDTSKEVLGKRAYAITFETGSDRILESSYAELDRIYSDLITTNLALVVNGHTDSQGSAEKNMALSQRRADSVKMYLVNKGGPKLSSRITTVAHGQSEPVGSNDTPAGRAANRRVEIVLGR